MNRNEEYWALIHDLNDTPPALDATLLRAKARRKKARTGKWFGIPVASLGGLASAFILLVNCSLPFALACAKVPFLRDLTAAVAFSETLKAAVRNDYVQYVGKSQTVNGITFTIHYLILDPSQINIFYSIEGGDAAQYEVSPTAEGLGGYSYQWSDYTPGGPMGLVSLSLNPTDRLPEQLGLKLLLFDRSSNTVPAEAPVEAPAASAGPFGPIEFPSPEPLAYFSFTLPLEARFTAAAVPMDINQWVDLAGQRILLKQLDVYPLAAALRLGADDGNSAWLKSMHFYLEDETGKRYEQGNLSLFSTGEADSPAFLTYFLDSAYFQDAASLTLHITDASWLDKDKRYTNIDLSAGTADYLPAGVHIESVVRSGGDVHLTVRYPKLTSLFSGTHYDPEGGEHYRSYGMSGSSDLDYVDYITLEDYPWDTVRMELEYTRTTKFAAPITIKLK